MTDTWTLDALSEEAGECSARKLKKLLSDFGDDPSAVRVIHEAVTYAYDHEDSGDYRSNASSGYANAAKKMEVMKAFHLSAARRPKLSQKESTAGMAAVLAALERINSRLDKLEKEKRPPRRKEPERDHPFL